MSRRRETAGIIVALTLLPLPALPDVVATCGASKGHAYFLPGPLVPSEEAGWMEDGISNGSFLLIRSGKDYDIIFTDASGGTLSAKADGGEIVAFQSAKGDLVVTIFYPRAVETYAFWFSASGPLTVTYSQVKHDTPIPKHAVFKANCTVPPK